jgi:hypothetical protein
MIRLIIFLTTLLFLFGCASTGKVVANTEPLTKHESKGSAQLWSETCIRCHFLRPPDSHSDEEWEIIMLQMRFMANLSQEQHDKILKFLKSAN